jgi:hypothetical protein
MELLVREDAMAGRGKLLLSDPGAGDMRVFWDRDNRDEVEAALKQSEELRGEGFLAFCPEREGAGREGQVLEGCDPTAERIILLRPLWGG